jgi:CRP-like cAMP-binding protein
MSANIIRLRKFPLFEGLDDSDLEDIATLMKTARFEREQYLIKADDLSEEIYFIESGTVSVEVDIVGRPQNEQIAKIIEGQSVGEFILTKKARRSASARALSSVHAFCTTRTELIHLFEKRPRIGYIVFMNLSAILVDRLKNSNMLVRNIISTSVDIL